MFGNPYMNMFRDNQQQPIQNIINTQMPMNNEFFMARFLDKNERVDEIFVNHKTAFIDVLNKQLLIKDVNGSVLSYGLILPKDEKDKKIEDLQNQILELKGMINNESNANATTNDESTEQNGNAKKFNRKQ